MRFSRTILVPRLIVHSVLLLFIAIGVETDAAQISTTPHPTAMAGADAWQEPARELATKIASHLSPRAAVVLAVKNISSLTSDDGAAIRRVLREELRGKGLRIIAARSEQRRPVAAGKGAATEPESVAVTLSENVDGYLWVAEIRRASPETGTAEVAMIAVPRPAESGNAGTTVSLAIRRALLWEEDEPILDRAVIDASSSNLLVLDTENVSLVRLGSPSAAGSPPTPQVASAPLTHARPWPRDPRGRIAIEPEPGPPSGAAAPASRSFAAYLPGVKCQGAFEPGLTTGLTIDCSEADDPWPADLDRERSRFAAGRNFFEGRLVTADNSEIGVPPYFSSAELSGPTGSLEVFDGVDGRVRLRTNGRAVATPGGWGSNIAGIKVDCARRWLLLADSASESTEPDAVRAYEIDRDAAVAASLAVEFGGPITALWSEGDGSSVLAVSRNLRTGKYEAYSLSISCGQ